MEIVRSGRRYDAVSKESRPRQASQVASITSHWSNLTKTRQRAPHNIGKDGVMGEVERGLPILFRWRSSLWKLVWKQLFVYLLFYGVISVFYRFVIIGSSYEAVFVQLVTWLKVQKSLPLTFLLGFYVSLVVKRWWEQYVKLPWPDEVATLLKAGITKGDKEGENLRIRRTVIRYMLLSYVLCMRRISSSVRGTFVDMEALVATGLIREDEAKRIGEEEQSVIGVHGGSNWWMPVRWSISIVRKAQMDDKFINAPSYSNLIKAIAAFRKSLTQVATYGHVTVPLVYTQVVHLAVYFYFLVALIGRQWIQIPETKTSADAGFVEYLFTTRGDPRELDLFFPIFLTFEFLFFFGWLNVACTLYNPFGDDDDDFKLMDLMNRHIKVCMKIVDDDTDDIPEVQDDLFWQPPAGSSSDWCPTLTAMNVDVEGEKKIQRQWSNASQKVLALSASPESSRDPGIVSIAEERDVC